MAKSSSLKTNHNGAGGRPGSRPHLIPRSSSPFQAAAASPFSLVRRSLQSAQGSWSRPRPPSSKRRHAAKLLGSLIGGFVIVNRKAASVEVESGPASSASLHPARPRPLASLSRLAPAAISTRPSTQTTPHSSSPRPSLIVWDTGADISIITSHSVSLIFSFPLRTAHKSRRPCKSRRSYKTHRPASPGGHASPDGPMQVPAVVQVPVVPQGSTVVRAAPQVPRRKSHAASPTPFYRTSNARSSSGTTSARRSSSPSRL